MSDLVAAAAAALGVPEALVRRSAAARATATGMTVDEVLTAWAGGGTVAGDATPSVGEAPTPAPPEAEPAAEPAATETTPPSVGEAPTAPPATQEDDLAPAAVVTTRAPVPSEVSAAEAANLPEVVTVPTAGIRERTNFVFPKWLAAVMLIIPLFALFALGGAATGTCGEATELQTDVVSGEIVNCDGSEFTGSGVSGGGTDYLALGERVYNGEGATCAGCHGVGGGGVSGPALTGVLTTFGVCTDHLEWVTLGTSGFQAAGRATYGDTNKPVGGGGTMPSHASLSQEQLAAVVVFERVRFGGAEPDQALVDCGVGPEEPPAEGEGGTPPPEGEGGTPPPEGEGGAPPPEDGAGTTSTVAG
jgi:mono/diheme cytochrome c family protein